VHLCLLFLRTLHCNHGLHTLLMVATVVAQPLRAVVGLVV
jgi:hypothetical protein